MADTVWMIPHTVLPPQQRHLLGGTSLRVSRLCLGMMSFGDPCWQPWVLGERNAFEMVDAALDAGINFFDTADFYSTGESERLLGRAIRRSGQRADVVVATKIGLPMSADRRDRGLGRERVLRCVEQSMSRLDLGAIDLLHLHAWDADTPIDETLDALGELVARGWVRFVGASNYAAWQLSKTQRTARAHSWPLIATSQIQYNLAYREEEREMLPLCCDERIGVVAYSPLARGVLAGIRTDAGSDAERLRAATDVKGHRLYDAQAVSGLRDTVRTIAQARAVEPATVALAWLLRQPVIGAVVIGAVSQAHLSSAAQALSTTLTTVELQALEQGYQPRWPENETLSSPRHQGLDVR